MKFKHPTLILFCGLMWLAIGVFLMSLGMHLVLTQLRFPSFVQGHFSLLRYLTLYVGNPANTAILLITGALIVGYIKAKMVLAKSVQRQVKRISTLPNPSPLKLLYGKGYYLLIGCMILLGISLRFWPITQDTRGTIDITIGSALIHGAMLYFRTLWRKAYLARHRKDHP
jgi:hypothetical protein